MKLGQRTFWAVLALPSLVYVAYFVLPVVDSLRMSLTPYARATGLQSGFTLDSYGLIFEDASYLRAWFTTFRVAIEASLLTVFLGAIVAYALWRVGGRLRGYLSTIVLTPLLVSGVARAYGWIAIGGPNGPWPRLTEVLGLGPIPILFNETSVIVSFVHVFLPLVVILVLVRLDAIAPSIPRAAANLGAGPWTVAGRVLLPLAYPALASGFLLVFALSTAAYAVPAILGGGRVLTVAQLVYREYAVNFHWPLAAALASILTAVTVLSMLGYQALSRNWERRGTAVVEL
jgi:putative spermidine/putrescine transport system permease protein